MISKPDNLLTVETVSVTVVTDTLRVNERGRLRSTLALWSNRCILNKEYVVLEKDGIPVAALMDVDEFEDYLELQDPKVRRDIEIRRKEYLAGMSRPAEELLAELKAEEEREPRIIKKRGASARRQKI